MIAAVKFVSTVDSKLSQLDIENGQIIFVTDTRTLYVDFNDVRTEYNQIIVLRNEAHRMSILSPLKAFYFILETNILWRYDGNEWIQLTSPPKENIVFVNYNDLPTQGKDEVLYITEQKTFRWNGVEYIELGALTWGEF